MVSDAWWLSAASHWLRLQTWSITSGLYVVGFWREKVACRWVYPLYREGNRHVGTQSRHAVVTEVVSLKTEVGDSRYEGIVNRHIDPNSNIQWDGFIKKFHSFMLAASLRGPVAWVHQWNQETQFLCQIFLCTVEGDHKLWPVLLNYCGVLVSSQRLTTQTAGSSSVCSHLHTKQDSELHLSFLSSREVDERHLDSGWGVGCTTALFTFPHLWIQDMAI